MDEKDVQITNKTNQLLNTTLPNLPKVKKHYTINRLKKMDS